MNEAFFKPWHEFTGEASMDRTPSVLSIAICVIGIFGIIALFSLVTPPAFADCVMNRVQLSGATYHMSENGQEMVSVLNKGLYTFDKGQLYMVSPVVGETKYATDATVLVPPKEVRNDLNEGRRVLKSCSPN